MEIVLPAENPNLGKPRKAIKAQVTVVKPVPYTDISSDRLIDCSNILVGGSGYCQYYSAQEIPLMETCLAIGPSGLYGKGFWLKPNVDWTLVDYNGHLLLVPTRKIG